MDRIRVGVIGTGHLGKHHVRVYHEIPECRLVGIADIDSEVVQSIGDQYSVPAYTNYCDLLDKVDAVSIVTPTSTHGEITLDAIAAGCHVLVEKPIADNVESADQMIISAKKAGRILQVGHIERFNPGVLAMAKYVNQPRFLESHRLGPLAERVKDVGVVVDLMIHDLDLVLALINSPVVRLEAIGVPILTDREDIANARIRFENGCIADLTVSRVSLKTERKLRLFQSDMYLSLDYQSRKLQVYRKKQEDKSEKPKVVVETIDSSDEDPLTMELQSFCNTIINNGIPVVSGETGRDALSLALEITGQIESGWATIEQMPTSFSP